MVLSDATRHAIWIQSLLSQIGFNLSNPLPISINNKGSANLASNPVHHKQTKHIDIKHHFIRECIDMNTITISHIPTGENISDVLTKNLPFEKYSLFSGQLGLMLSTDN
jgi:methyl coenzyme M reductase subunit D